jgi:hypothetical protein
MSEVLASKTGYGAEVMIVYFASHKPIDVLVSRPVRNYNSIGTWFTSSAELARTLYGPLVYAFELPPGRYLEAHTYDFSEFFTNWPLAEDVLPKKDFRYLREHAPGTPAFDRRADRLVRRLLLDQGYVQAFRAMLENANYDGVVWRDSRIDLSPRDAVTHDVFLVFQRGPFDPLELVDVEPLR